MEKKSVLFICPHNSARSQMAQAFLNWLAGDRFEAESAGLDSGHINSLAIEVMMELGIDISRNRPKDVSELLRAGKSFHYAVTVCDEASGCPTFPGHMQQLRWTVPDPSGLRGTHHEKLKKARQIRDAIKARIEAWIMEV